MDHGYEYRGRKAPDGAEPGRAGAGYFRDVRLPFAEPFLKDIP